MNYAGTYFKNKAIEGKKPASWALKRMVVAQIVVTILSFSVTALRAYLAGEDVWANATKGGPVLWFLLVAVVFVIGLSAHEIRTQIEVHKIESGNT